MNVPKMDNPSPHKMDCPANQQPIQLGLAYFCPICERRLGFLPKEQGEQKIIDALKNDIGG